MEGRRRRVVSTSRRRRRHKAGLVEGFVLAGAALGLWVASKDSARTHAATKPCPKSSASCLDHAIGSAFGRLFAGAIAGALIGLVLAIVLLLLLRTLRRPKRGSRRSAPGTLAAARLRRSTATATVPEPGSPNYAGISSTSPELTAQELRDLRLKVRKSVLDAMREMGGRGERNDILQRALSIGCFTSRELGARPAKSTRHKYSRLIDHDLSWALTDLKRDGLANNPAKGIWMLTDGANTEPESPLAETAIPERVSELRAMPYGEYLRTPEWRHTRAAALERADHRCALDPNHTDRLEVHHRYYERRGAELPSDLIVLCQACHRRHHLGNGRVGPSRGTSA